MSEPTTRQAITLVCDRLMNNIGVDFVPIEDLLHLMNCVEAAYMERLQQMQPYPCIYEAEEMNA